MSNARPSDSTIEEPCKPFRKAKELPEPEPLDDDVIKNKIREANQLIDRVKKALGKIKAIQSGSEWEDGESGLSKSTSTDIEETIKNLKEETAQLLTDDNEQAYLQQDIDLQEPKSRCGSRSSKKKESSLNRTFIKEDKERRCSDLGDQDINALTIAKIEPLFEDLEDVRNSNHCFDKLILGKDDVVGLERPKTRRNEIDDDLTEQIRRDKFRSCPEAGRLEITSSFEELQTKLQTISETTESNYSTPRKKSIDFPIYQNCKYCCTEPVSTENKEVQVTPEQNTAAIECICPCVDQSVQARVPKILTKRLQVESISPRRAPCLESKNLSPQEVVPIKKCTSCQAEYLPIIELLPPPKKQICDKCKRNLQEEHLGGVAIPSKLQKLKKLKVQVLPPIIIQQTLTLTQVLNLSISPAGECENRVKNAHNVVFIDVKPCGNDPKDDDRNDEIVEEEALPELPKNHTDDDLVVVHDSNGSEENQYFEGEQSAVEYEESEVELKQIDNDFDLVKWEKQSVKEKTKDRDLRRNTTPEEEEEETQKKMLWYKSYHIYDNPNKHDPGTLDKKSLEKVSQIDLEFYKTFINPDPTFSDDHFTPNMSRNRISGFESRTVQCNESMFSVPEEIGLSKGEASGKSDRLRFKPTKIADRQPQKPHQRAAMDELESEITVLHVKADKPQIQVAQSSAVFRRRPVNLDAQSSGASVSSGTTSPSEITVTVSYTSSSDEGDSKRSIAEFHESVIKTTNWEALRDSSVSSSRKSDAETKILTAADKSVIQKLHKKLRNVDTRKSQPNYTMTKDSTNCETIENFLKGLTNVSDQYQCLRDSEASRREQMETNLQNEKEPSLDDTESRDSEPDEGKQAKPQDKNHTVNYVFNKELTTFEHAYTNHLELGKNGRYKDEEDLFTQVPYATIANSLNKMEVPQCLMKPKAAQQFLFEHRDKEVARDKLLMIPRHRLNRYSPDTSNSDTVTTNSVSEGEIRCKHTVSNGEIHVCRHRPQCPRLPRTILTKRNVTFSPTRRSPHTLPRELPRNFDLNDPKVTIEQRRNYFDNWVTYYVRPHDVHETSTSNCSNNKP